MASGYITFYSNGSPRKKKKSSSVPLGSGPVSLKVRDEAIFKQPAEEKRNLYLGNEHLLEIKVSLKSNGRGTVERE